MVARSSAEAEFRVVAHGICEVMWIKRMLEELKASASLPMNAQREKTFISMKRE